jgi:hypothetical protein
MNIDFKYDIDDEFWIMDENKPKKMKVRRVEFIKERRNIDSDVLCRVVYMATQSSILFSENEIFLTKQDLINSL